MDSTFRPIRPDSIPKEVVRQIKDLIREGKLHPGQKLPSERVLSEMLGVGRSSLREAVNTLETMGLVEKRSREGIFVRSIASPIIADPLMQMLEEDVNRFFDLYEIRKDIEMASAYRAAQNRTKKDLTQMQAVLEKMKHNATKTIIAREDDLEFHMSVAVGSHNLLRVHTLKNIFDLFGDFIKHVAVKLNQDNENVMLNISQHLCVFDAIREGDAEGARDRMNEHLSWVEERWKEVGVKKM